MSPSCPHTGSKSYAPLINCAVNNTVPCGAKHPRDAASVDRHRERVTDRHAAERCPRFCSQLGLGRGCSEATDQVRVQYER